MKVTIIDERDEDILTLGFMTVEDGDKYLHASVDIYTSGNVYFQDFMNGHIGKYEFQGDRYYTDRREHNGGAFMGAGRGRKPDSAFVAMREFIKKVDNLEIKLDEAHKVESKRGTMYVFEM